MRKDQTKSASFPALDRALSEGAILHGFRSGGGLRVLRIERGDVLLGYGEHADVGGSLSLIEEDTAAGHRPYDQVYGVLHPHYLTGSSEAASVLDAVLLAGGKVDAWAEPSGSIMVRAIRTMSTTFPEEIVREASETGRSVRHTSRGYVFELVPTQDRDIHEIRVVSVPHGGDATQAFFCKVSFEGRGDDLAGALAALELSEPRPT